MVRVVGGTAAKNLGRPGAIALLGHAARVRDEEGGVRLTPHEQERLLVHVAADVARGRRARGLRLNHPEAMAILIDWVLEAARDGHSVADLMQTGRAVLGRDDVVDGLPEMIADVQVEATLPDDTKLVTLHQPIV